MDPTEKQTMPPAAACDDRADHISDLSDDLLLHILCLLPFSRDAAHTSALSRRWRDLWTRGPVLRLNQGGCAIQNPDNDARYNDFVHKVLARRAYDDASVHKLELRSWLWPGKSRAEVWLRRAMRLVVGSLDFDVYKSRRRRKKRRMPRHLADKQLPKLPLSTSTRAVRMSLHLDYAALLLPRTVNFHALTDLTLYRILFIDGDCDRLGGLLSSSSCCPKLQTLTLRNLSGLEELQLNSRTLEILDMADLSVKRLDVNAPRLLELHVESGFMLRRYHEHTSLTMQAPALETLQCPLSIGDYQLENQYYMFQLLQECRPINRHIIWLSVQETEGEVDDVIAVIPQLPRVTNLTLKFHSTNNGHFFGPTVTSILARCSNLQFLHLDFRIYSYGRRCEVGCSTCGLRGSWEDDVISLDHLREVKFSGFSGQEYCLDMVRLLLLSAPALERMLVTAKSCVEGWRRLDKFESEPQGITESLGSSLPRGMGRWTARPAANAPAAEYEWMPI